MYTPKRQSMASAVPMSPLGPIIPRPSSAASQAPQHRTNNISDASSDTADARNVRVVVRIRPSLADDSVPLRLRNVLIHPTSASDLRIDVDPSQLTGNAGLTTGAKRHPSFQFDHVLGEESSQVDLYDVTGRDVVEEYMKGHNVTFLAYGQTSSGKSYSMGTTGEDIDYSGTAFTPRTGLIPRTVRAIFDRAEEIRLASGPGSSWECRLSFLELYNEEIIDLLSGAGVQITIREERDGRIIWSGIREVKVKTLAEVMQLLQDGAARRQTGETGMNATSSRSHAIFSLTMVQKKRAGIIVSPSQPISPPGTPKTLKRPTSFIGMPRSITPSGSRTGPPVAFTQKQSGIPRPNSMLGHREDEFVVVTSKFNMVDLAGSERLKRTAAQGDRMKEGISINSGLSALGNVISALSDPRSAKGHIPYRDSKLTRMLQDSIGGNALTTMIACVSPIEYNVAETLNTIKYASRARNIKNTSKVNAVEAGWDDVEHLQTTVLKLRKQIAALDTEGSAGGATGMAGRTSPGDAQRQSEKLIQRLAELQREHTELYDRYLAKCNENMRLTSELKSATPGDADVLARFNETVEPVILEYEKVVSALNIQLDDLRAQLSLLDTLYEEQGRGLVEAQERQTQSESYAAELRARVGKLSDQNSSGESYINDLEAKLKAHTDASDGHTDAAVELRKEITRLKALNDSLSQHSAEIESRLSQSEDKSVQLVQQIERLEAEVTRRETSYRELESHIAILDTTHDNKLLVTELEERSRHIAELERERREAEEREAGQRERLEKLLKAERITQDELRQQLSRHSIPTPPPSRLVDSATTSTSRDVSTTSQITPPDTPERRLDTEDEVSKLKEQIVAMARKAGEAEERYTAAQARVEELQTQLVEVQEANDTLPITPSISLNHLDDMSENGTTLLTPKDTSPGPSPSRMKRGSMPILSATGFGTAKGGGFRGGRGYGESRSKHQSLSQELSSAQQSLTSSRSSWGGSNSSLFGQSSSRQSMPSIKPLRTQQQSMDMRTQTSIETELKFLHKVVEDRDEDLRQKEAYIRKLETSLSLQNQSHNIPSRKTSAPPSFQPTTPPSSIPLPSSPDNPGISLPSESGSSGESVQQLDTPMLSEDTHGQLGVPPQAERFFTPAGEITDPLEFQHAPSQPQSDLLLEMQTKEASQRAIIDQQFKQIADLQKINLKLRDELHGGQYPQLYRSLDDLRQINADHSDKTLSPSTPKPSSPFTQLSPSRELNALRDSHAEELQTIINGHAQTIEALQRDCDERISVMEKQVEAMAAEYEEQLRRLQAHHSTELSSRQQIHDDAVAKIRKDGESMSAELNASLASHDEARRQLKMKADQALFELSRVRDESHMQRNADAKQIADLLQVKANLEEAINELEVSKVDWMKRNSELEQRYSRKIVPPPQGPPPNMPLPPTPSTHVLLAGTSAGQRSPPVSKAERGRSQSHSGSSEEAHESLSHAQDIEAAVPLLPAHVGQMVQAVMAEKARVAAEAEVLRKQLGDRAALVQETEQQLTSEVEKSQTLSRELADARKTSSKLRAHLEDSRQETRRQQDECKAHMEELTERRQQVNRVEEHKRSERDSLHTANAQVAALKAQLEKAVDAKVNKKMGSKLKCF